MPDEINDKELIQKHLQYLKKAKELQKKMDRARRFYYVAIAFGIATLIIATFI